MKKILVIFIVLFVLISGVYSSAATEAYTDDPEYASSAWSSALGQTDNIVSNEHVGLPGSMIWGASSLIGGTMMRVAGIFDEATMTFCLGMTPFPNILQLFYGNTVDGKTINGMAVTDITPSNALLISDGYYQLSNGILTMDGKRSDGVSYTKTVSGVSSAVQRSSWNMVTVLFLSFFAAEIIFSAIYGYLTDKEGGILKEIISKGLLCILMFLLLSALPFLVEAFRYGFLLMARTITGVENQYEQTSNLTTRKAQILSAMVNATVFEYPGLLVRNLTYVIDSLDPENVGGTGVNLYNAVDFSLPTSEVEEGDNWLMRGLKWIWKQLASLLAPDFLLDPLIRLVYLGVRILACILISFSALHIMLNICEVYLLLGVTICITPFVVFSPLKFLGEKAIMSLFSNMMELFILLMVIFTTFNMVDSITSSLLSALQISITSATIQVSGLTQSNYAQLTGDASLQNEDIENQIPTFNILLSPHSVTVPTVGEAQEYVGGMMKWLNSKFESMRDDGILQLTNWTTDAVNTITDANALLRERDNLTLADVPIGDKLEFIKIISSQAAPLGIGISTLKQTGSIEKTTSFDLFAAHIFISFLCIFMQTYFVNQSSQITNAILSGNVSSEGITAAMGKFLAAKAAGGAVKKAAKVGGAALGAVGSVPGAIGGAALAKAASGMANTSGLAYKAMMGASRWMSNIGAKKDKEGNKIDGSSLGSKLYNWRQESKAAKNGGGASGPGGSSGEGT